MSVTFLMRGDAIRFWTEVKLECYAIPWRLWRAAIYCVTLWLPLPLPRLFLSRFLDFVSDLVKLACLVECLTARDAAEGWQ